MSSLGDAIGRRKSPRSKSASDGGAASASWSPTEAASSATTPPHPPPASEHSELRRRRDALAEQVTELHWDLGGLAYEMAVRDHFRLDVLVRRAAVLQERDAELAEVERLLRLEDSASAGSCPSCGAPHSRGAVFCWQCGTTLMSRTEHGGAEGASDGEHDDSTAVMDALLARAGTSPVDGRSAPSSQRRSDE